MALYFKVVWKSCCTEKVKSGPSCLVSLISISFVKFSPHNFSMDNWYIRLDAAINHSLLAQLYSSQHLEVFVTFWAICASLISTVWGRDSVWSERGPVWNIWKQGQQGEGSCEGLECIPAARWGIWILLLGPFSCLNGSGNTRSLLVAFVSIS